VNFVGTIVLCLVVREQASEDLRGSSAFSGALNGGICILPFLAAALWGCLLCLPCGPQALMQAVFIAVCDILR